jgi:RNA polymerase sigma factor (sigma-70 family)
MENYAAIDTLLRAAQSNDLRAERELFTNLRARLFNLAKCILLKNYHVQDSEVREADAEDIAQNALIIIQQKYKTQTFDNGFFSWVNRILRNTIGNYMRAKLRRDQTFDALKTFESPPENDNQWIEKIDSRDLLKKILHCIRKFGDVCKKILLIFANEGTREDVILEFSGAPIVTIDSRISRCRQKLKAYLRKEGILL